MRSQRLGDLNILLRYEADACLQSRPPNRTSIEHPPSMALLSHGLTILGHGNPVQESSIVELKTIKEEIPFRAKRIQWGKHYPQVYFSQTQHLFVATHHQGLFHTVTKGRICDAGNVALTVGTKLGKLHDALKTIQEMVIETGLEGRLSLVSRNGELEAVERKDRSSCLPEDLLLRFFSREDVVN